MSFTPADKPDAPSDLRRAIRDGTFRGPTAGLAPGFAQGNIAILPERWAAAFEEFCRSNAQACPLLARSRPGEWRLTELGGDIDIRRDVPRYRVYRDGIAAGETDDILALWSPDFVTFALGCSFTFEHALLAAGLPVRHIEEGRNVPVYRTNRPVRECGPFGGGLVVSMRPMLPGDVARATAICRRFPNSHGEPVHVGDPAALGIADLDAPDFGDPPVMRPGEVPVFWACGVTSLAALERAALPIFITHAPGYMLITDLLDKEYIA